MKAVCFNIVSHSLTLFTVDQEHMKDTWFNAAIVRDLMYSKHKIERTHCSFRVGDNKYSHCEVVTVRTAILRMTRVSDTWDYPAK
jgi:hypothetical protein